MIFLFLFCIHPLCICTCFLSLKFNKQQIPFHLYTRKRSSYSNNHSHQTSTNRGSLWVTFPSFLLRYGGVHASSSPAALNTAAGYTSQLEGNCTLWVLLPCLWANLQLLTIPWDATAYFCPSCYLTAFWNNTYTAATKILCLIHNPKSLLSKTD